MPITVNTKDDINSTYVSEVAEYQRLLLKGTTRTTGVSGSWISTSSSVTYAYSNGEQDLYEQLKVVLDTYQIDAEDWNDLIAEIRGETGTIGRVQSFVGLRGGQVASGGVNTDGKTFTLNPFSTNSYIDVDIDPSGIYSWKDIVLTVNLTTSNNAYYQVFESDRTTPIVAETALSDGVNILDISTIDASTDPHILVRLKITRSSTSNPTASISDFSVGWIGNKYAEYDTQPISVTASGTNTYTATTLPSLKKYSIGQPILVKFANANTSTSCSLTIDSLSAIPILTTSLKPLNIGDINTVSIYTLIYDGSQFRVDIGQKTYRDVPLTSVPFVYADGNGVDPNNLNATNSAINFDPSDDGNPYTTVTVGTDYTSIGAPTGYRDLRMPLGIQSIDTVGFHYDTPNPYNNNVIGKLYNVTDSTWQDATGRPFNIQSSQTNAYTSITTTGFTNWQNLDPTKQYSICISSSSNTAYVNIYYDHYNAQFNALNPSATAGIRIVGTYKQYINPRTLDVVIGNADITSWDTIDISGVTTPSDSSVEVTIKDMSNNVLIATQTLSDGANSVDISGISATTYKQLKAYVEYNVASATPYDIPYITGLTYDATQRFEKGIWETVADIALSNFDDELEIAINFNYQKIVLEFMNLSTPTGAYFAVNGASVALVGDGAETASGCYGEMTVTGDNSTAYKLVDCKSVYNSGVGRNTGLSRASVGTVTSVGLLVGGSGSTFTAGTGARCIVRGLI